MGAVIERVVADCGAGVLVMDGVGVGNGVAVATGVEVKEGVGDVGGVAVQALRHCTAISQRQAS